MRRTVGSEDEPRGGSKRASATRGRAEQLAHGTATATATTPSFATDGDEEISAPLMSGVSTQASPQSLDDISEPLVVPPKNPCSQHADVIGSIALCPFPLSHRTSEGVTKTQTTRHDRASRDRPQRRIVRGIWHEVTTPATTRAVIIVGSGRKLS